MSTILEKIKVACDWVNAKGKGSKDTVKVTTQVKWADWERKWFSPAMAVLWYSEVHQSGENAYDTFWIPDNATWVSKVATYLGVAEEWVESFVKQCYTKCPPEQYSFTITFDGLGADIAGTYSNICLKNPKFEFNKTNVNVEMLEEAQYCIEHYGDLSQGKEMQYWTKNPPISMYQGKLMQAAYELFAAMQASE
jgi:hypothetical protein